MPVSASSQNPLQSFRKKVLFLSDLDGTWLSKSPKNRAKLDREIVKIRDEYAEKGVDLKFGYITARPPQRVEKEELPEPDWTVTYNGAQVNVGDAGDFEPDGSYTEKERATAWDDENRKTGFTTDKARSELMELLSTEQFSNLSLKTVGEVVENPAADANEFSLSVCFEQDNIALAPGEERDKNNNDIPDLFEPETFAAPEQITQLREQLDSKFEEAGIGHQVSPAYLFHGKPYVMFDIASPLANKGEAVRFLQSQEQVDAEHTIVAGDGGNDIAMMTGRDGGDEGRRTIVVGKDAGLNQAASELKNALIQPSEMDSALGVLTGLRHHLDAIVAE